MSAQRRRRTTRRPATRRRAARYTVADFVADLLTLAALAVLVALAVVELGWRFAAGQVVARRPGKYDSLWGSWAPPLPKRMQGRRDVAAPRTTWGRRPGWHRQLVRLVVVALATGLWNAPVLTAAVVAGLAVTAALAVGLLHLVRHRAARADHSDDGLDDEQDDDASGNGGGATGRPAAPVLEHKQRPARRPRRKDRSAQDGEVLAEVRSEVRSGLVVDVPAQRGPCRPVLDLDALVDSMNVASMNATPINGARGGLS